MLKQCLLLFSLFIYFQCDAACPITHAYLTKQLFKHFPKYTAQEQQEFMVGTLFPDIRYLGSSTRAETHFDEMSLQDVLNEKDPFMAGVKFHSFVDIERENLVCREKMYDKFEAANPATYLKLIEDEILFSEAGWADICQSLQNVKPAETKMCQEAEVQKWHKILNLFFMALPSQNLNMLSLMGKGALGMTPEEIQTWSKTLRPSSQEDVMVKWAQKLVEHFDTLFEKEKQN